MGQTFLIGALVLWLLALAFFRLNRIWLLYYFTGSVGLAFAIIFVGRATPLEPWLEATVAFTVYLVTNAIGIATQVFDAAPGALLVLVISQDIGWTVVQVTLECSGLLEAAVMVGLFAFYPTWSIPRKAVVIGLGLLGTYAANILRLAVIVAVLHYFGKDSLFMSHTIAGRGIFFLATVAMYWYLLTSPTLRDVRRKLEGELTR